MIMNAEARRNAALREIERHRASIAEALRRVTDDIVDAEFEDVAPALLKKTWDGQRPQAPRRSRRHPPQHGPADGCGSGRVGPKRTSAWPEHPGAVRSRFVRRS
jgi:hypothetical protein